MNLVNAVCAIASTLLRNEHEKSYRTGLGYLLQPSSSHQRNLLVFMRERKKKEKSYRMHLLGKTALTTSL